jgi:hypothetical protein
MKCQFEGCIIKRAYFGFEGMNAMFCVNHKEDGMIDLKHPKCICKLARPSFGLEGGKATHCVNCKEDIMIDVVSKKCCKCSIKTPAFGFVGEKATCCGDCKEENMINVKSKKCIKCNIKQPAFGFVGEKATCCGECKEENMIDLKHHKCIECKNKRSCFGFEGENPTHCGECKEEHMIDVTSKKCIQCDIKSPYFGLKGGKPTHCADCKEENMIDVRSKKCLKCNIKHPFFGLKGGKPTHCADCKEENMFDVKNKKCKSNYCETLANRYYDGYCAFCYGNLFPDSPVVRNFKTKERLVVDYIKEVFPDYTWIFDKIIEGACSKRRPDIYLELGYQIIIIEVDENQHKQYEDICENKRMMILSEDVNHHPIVFIRFNPDTYTDSDNIKIKSCFSITKETGKLKVNNKTNWNNRLLRLKESIEYWVENKTDKILELVQLFYDEI